MRSRSIRCSNLAVSALVGLMCSMLSVQALVISSPQVGNSIPRTTGESSNAVSKIEDPISIRIRSTRVEDLDQIASLLSAAAIKLPPSMQDGESPGWNWNMSVNALRKKASFRKLMSQRLNTMNEGRRLMSEIHDGDPLFSPSSDRLRLLWSQDDFRVQMERAARLSNEQNAWHNHKCAADSDEDQHRWLQHAMLTAEDTRTRAVVGFCEVAMMGHGYHDGNGNGKESFHAVPTIANLVACSRNRRRGIASTLLRSATRYVSRHWNTSTDEIALFVEKGNRGAISLYSKHKFQLIAGHGDKLRMVKELDVAS